MNNQTYEITIDTKKSHCHSNIEFSQNNLNISEFIFNITEDEKEFPLKDTDKIIVYFRKPDKTVVFQDKEVILLDKAKGKIKVLLTTQTLAKSGDVHGEISIERVENGTKKRVSTYGFTFKVRSSIASNDSIESTNEFQVFDKIIKVGEKFEGVDIDGIIAAGAKADAALPKAGGSMTGHLGLDRANSSTILDVRWKTAGVDEILIGQDAAGNWRAFNSKLGKSFFVYAKDSDTFNINANNTNVVKKTEVYTNFVKPDGGCISISNTELDNLKAPGFYSGYTLGNAPAGITGTLYVDVTMHTPTYIKQEATTATAPTIQKYTRELINNVWSPWQKLAREDDVVTKVKDGTVNLPITSDFTPTSSTVQNIVRRGNTVTLMLDVTRNANSTSPIVTTLPEGLRPVGSLTTDIAATDGTMSRLLIRFNGEIHLDTIGKRYRILQTFVTA
ncbi:BppU family phage baseplate upper protein [Bacillus wiedmannii]|uniref:BppU family phage baseplate upper protein n=1 Tax=Bacillus wiedmannii TaxID=1890302 RepID=UPI0021D2D29B|nr:BppU family phage baseplate upper protein [Bacillus wiedmannii]MCU5497585.1 BppU family phage baseplate upper protein [Bacillus wiedmannii]